MTIHTAFRFSQPAAPHLETAARRATDREGLSGLLSALGIECEADAQDDQILRRMLRRPDIAFACRIAERGSLLFMLAELSGEIGSAVIIETARAFRAVEPVRPFLAIIAAANYRSITLACFAAGELRHLTFDPASPLASDLDILRDMVSSRDDSGVAVALRFATALDSRVVNARFFAEVRSQRDRIAAAWSGIPVELKAERDQLALLLLCRLLFLYFLERQGHLAGDPHYLQHMLQRWQRDGDQHSSLYGRVLSPLFFGCLNTRPERRTADALALGPLPYLNGGLFDRHALERRYPDLDLPDSTAAAVFENLLERFRFTANDAATAFASDLKTTQIDPEMLGRVFEGLMSADRRGDTGSFYTPPHMVGRLTSRVLTEHVSRVTGEPYDA
ncbi:MAG: hypothetical protein ABIV28_05440, partial [Longimicrobiales bacterium]